MRTAQGPSCWPSQCSLTLANTWPCRHRSTGDLWYHPAASFLCWAQPGLESPWGVQAQGVLKLHPKITVHINFEHPAVSLSGTLSVPSCPVPSPGWPQGFWTALSASPVLLVLSSPQCPGEGRDGAAGGAELVMEPGAGSDRTPGMHRSWQPAGRHSGLPVPAQPWACIPGLSQGAPGRTGPGAGGSLCWNGPTGQRLLEKGHGDSLLWGSTHTNLLRAEPILAAQVPKIFIKWKTCGANQHGGIKYFLLHAFAPGFFLLKINQQHMGAAWRMSCCFHHDQTCGICIAQSSALAAGW